ncbi:hypothetical protein ACF0H5_011617 [Mactra antiquata]
MLIIRIILVSVSLTVIASQRNYNVRNWQNIYTTLRPPTSPKPTHARRLSVLDTIKAAAEASRRLYSSSSTYTEKVVKPMRFINKGGSNHAPEPRRQPSVYPKETNNHDNRVQDSPVYALYAEPQPAHPTAETHFNRQRQLTVNNAWERGTGRPSSSINDRYGQVAQSKTSAPAKRDPNSWRPEFSLNDGSSRRRNEQRHLKVDSTGGRYAQQTGRARSATLLEETNMFDTGGNSYDAQSKAKHYEIQASVGKDPIALYAVDGKTPVYGHGSGSWSQSSTYSATRPPSYAAATAHGQNFATRTPRYGKSTPRNRYSDQGKTTEQQRFKVLPNGSIVDYGFINRRNRARKTTRAPLVTTDNKPIRIFTTGLTTTRNATKPTAATLTTSRLHFTQVPKTRTSASVPSIRLTTALRTLAPTTPRPTLATQRKTTTLKLSTRQKYISPSGGVSITDLYNFTSGFFGEGNGSSSAVTVDQYQHTNLTHPTWPYGNHPTTPQRAPVIALATTTTVRTTTTLPPTTTTRKPKDDYFYKQGGVPINISYGNDNHVCPSSRARWQDFTVYLETKPRLCMIQITFNARYKREPIYHNTWWGNSVEWIYKTVYDPEVKIVDLHGWRGSNWYG